MSQTPIQSDFDSARLAAGSLAPADLSERLEVFHGEANPAVARVYARLAVAVDEWRGTGELTLGGRLVGPECAFAHTLPLRMPFLSAGRAGSGDPRTIEFLNSVGGGMVAGVDQREPPAGTGNSGGSAASTPATPRERGVEGLLAEAVVPDPCFWTPELPFLYRAEIELRRGAELLWRCERLLGIRRLGVRGQSLFFDGKRFVLRGAMRPPMGSGEWGMGNDEAFARESWTALVVPEPSDEVCELASRRGVLLVADLTPWTRDFIQGDFEHCSLSPGERPGVRVCDQTAAPSPPPLPTGEALEMGGTTELIAELRRLAQWPAVGIVLLGGDAAAPNDLRSSVQNLLLAQSVTAVELLSLVPWAQLAFIEVNQLREFANKTADVTLPMVVVRRLAEPATIEAARAGCDALQHDLAFAGDFAGYVV